MVSVNCLNSFDDIVHNWDAVLSLSKIKSPFLTYQWQSSWWQEFGAKQGLSILEIESGQQIIGIASLRYENGDLTLVGDQDLCDHNDFLISEGNEFAFYTALLDYLENCEWNNLILYSLTDGSPTLELFPELAKDKGYDVEIRLQDVSPGAVLPVNWDEYLSSLSKKHRHELKRKLRRLESQESIRWYSIDDLRDIEDGMDHFFRLLKMSKDTKYKFLTPERERFFRSIGKNLGGIGLVKLFFMEIEGERVASALCFDYDSKRFLYNSGFNPEYGYYSVGLLLKALSLKSAIEDNKTYYDFLRGDEPYKYHLGGVDQHLFNMVITRP
ncbi:GNAT family N-acetyltransferase [SAR202 cluster bacterium AC-409-J13_OGT_754m]|nr:GNAT family N-acetyltransferase [SAR202 cluster bacterium AC-409-J13_OGT_754m]